MSSPGIQSINSGPLIIRTYNQSVSTLSTNNTYLLGQYDTPVPSNYILITTLNGQLYPTNHPTISSITISTLNTNQGYFSTLSGSTMNISTINSCTIIGSNLTLDGIASFTPSSRSYNEGDSIIATYRNKYVFITSLSDNIITNLTRTLPVPLNGTFISFTNVLTNIYSLTLQEPGVIGSLLTNSTIYPGSTLQIMFFNGFWQNISLF